jgi:hypothetical protein
MEADLELVKAVARQQLAAGQGELDLLLPDSPSGGGPLPTPRRGWAPARRDVRGL